MELFVRHRRIIACLYAVAAFATFYFTVEVGPKLAGGGFDLSAAGIADRVDRVRGVALFLSLLVSILMFWNKAPLWFFLALCAILLNAHVADFAFQASMVPAQDWFYHNKGEASFWSDAILALNALLIAVGGGQLFFRK